MLLSLHVHPPPGLQLLPAPPNTALLSILIRHWNVKAVSARGFNSFPHCIYPLSLSNLWIYYYYSLSIVLGWFVCWTKAALITTYIPSSATSCTAKSAIRSPKGRNKYCCVAPLLSNQDVTTSSPFCVLILLNTSCKSGYLVVQHLAEWVRADLLPSRVT